MNKVMRLMAMLSLRKAEEDTTCLQVDPKQGFQKCSFNRYSRLYPSLHSVIAASPSRFNDVDPEDLSSESDKLERVGRKAGQCWDTDICCAQPARSVYRIFSSLFHQVTFNIADPNGKFKPLEYTANIAKKYVFDNFKIYSGKYTYSEKKRCWRRKKKRVGDLIWYIPRGGLVHKRRGVKETFAARDYDMGKTSLWRSHRVILPAAELASTFLDSRPLAYTCGLRRHEAVWSPPLPPSSIQAAIDHPKTMSYSGDTRSNVLVALWKFPWMIPGNIALPLVYYSVEDLAHWSCTNSHLKASNKVEILPNQREGYEVTTVSEAESKQIRLCLLPWQRVPCDRTGFPIETSVHACRLSLHGTSYRGTHGFNAINLQGYKLYAKPDTMAEMDWTTRLPPTSTGYDSRRGHSRIFACGNRAGRRRRWSAGFLGDLPFPTHLHSGAAAYSPRSALIGPQDLDVKSRSHFFTPLSSHIYKTIMEATGYGGVSRIFIIACSRSFPKCSLYHEQPIVEHCEAGLTPGRYATRYAGKRTDIFTVSLLPEPKVARRIHEDGGFPMESAVFASIPLSKDIPRVEDFPGLNFLTTPAVVRGMNTTSR
ncbi:hypothetical protein PR048_023812 [Dryococelus australis]|uniref:Uncharacterized protein n=1 Tax=Dryococelus australis TaxID=614101 RepID=A0ABQ9GV33_9NEOP|nr:hypothetical protein PR048_023812 [Dryococelus australis]